MLTLCKVYSKDKGNNLYDIGSVVRLLAVMLLGQQLDDGLGQLHLLVLLLSQSRPYNGEDQHPQVIGHLGLSMGNLPQGSHQIADLQLPCAKGENRSEGNFHGVSSSS